MIPVKFSLLILSITVLLQNSSALSQESHEKMMSIVKPIFKECDTQLGVDHTMPSEAGPLDMGNPLKCRAACIFKKLDVIDREGKYDKNKALSFFAENITNGDDLEDLNKAAETCETVNSEAVTDADEGCDRAILLISCMAQHAKIFMVQPTQSSK